jgi:hypothetical protein
MTRYSPSQLRQMADELSHDAGGEGRYSVALRQAADDAEKLSAIEWGEPEYVGRLVDAIEGELDGLSIDDTQAQNILQYVATGLSPDELDAARFGDATRTPKEQKK